MIDNSLINHSWLLWSSLGFLVAYDDNYDCCYESRRLREKLGSIWKSLLNPPESFLTWTLCFPLPVDSLNGLTTEDEEVPPPRSSDTFFAKLLLSGMLLFAAILRVGWGLSGFRLFYYWWLEPILTERWFAPSVSIMIWGATWATEPLEDWCPLADWQDVWWCWRLPPPGYFIILIVVPPGAMCLTEEPVAIPPPPTLRLPELRV